MPKSHHYFFLVSVTSELEANLAGGEPKVEDVHKKFHCFVLSNDIQHCFVPTRRQQAAQYATAQFGFNVSDVFILRTRQSARIPSVFPIASPRSDDGCAYFFRLFFFYGNAFRFECFSVQFHAQQASGDVNRILSIAEYNAASWTVPLADVHQQSLGVTSFELR